MLILSSIILIALGSFVILLGKKYPKLTFAGSFALFFLLLYIQTWSTPILITGVVVVAISYIFAKFFMSLALWLILFESFVLTLALFGALKSGMNAPILIISLVAPIIIVYLLRKKIYTIAYGAVGGFYTGIGLLLLFLVFKIGTSFDIGDLIELVFLGSFGVILAALLGPVFGVIFSWFFYKDNLPGVIANIKPLNDQSIQRKWIAFAGSLSVLFLLIITISVFAMTPKSRYYDDIEDKLNSNLDEINARIRKYEAKRLVTRLNSYNPRSEENQSKTKTSITLNEDGTGSMSIETEDGTIDYSVNKDGTGSMSIETEDGTIDYSVSDEGASSGISSKKKSKTFKPSIKGQETLYKDASSGEILIFRDSDILYKANTSKNEIKLIKDGARGNTHLVKFPGDAKVYGITMPMVEGSTQPIIVTNPDGTKQTFRLVKN